jgi:hypothetical protein
MPKPDDEVKNQYTRFMFALQQTGVTSLLPQVKKYGVIGTDGIEYPAPTFEEVELALENNSELVERKQKQGFTQLLLTPLAMPIIQLMDKAIETIRAHATTGIIFQTKGNENDADIPVDAHVKSPIWIWEKLRQALDTSQIIYFPQVYTKHDNKGLTKEEVINSTELCAVKGWSIGLIEAQAIMPHHGQETHFKIKKSVSG